MIRYTFNNNYFTYKVNEKDIARALHDYVVGFSQCMAEIKVPIDVAERTARRAASYFTLPHRKYHHVMHPLAIMQWYTDMLSSNVLPALSLLEQLAIWSHQICYEAGSVDNKHLSCDFILQSIGDHLTPDARRALQRMILATDYHEWTKVPPDCAYVCDLDLAVLSYARDTFRHCLRLIRDEYHDVSDEEFAKGAVAFFTTMTKRPFIFRTTAMRRYQGTAIANLHHAITNLTCGLA